VKNPPIKSAAVRGEKIGEGRGLSDSTPKAQVEYDFSKKHPSIFPYNDWNYKVEGQAEERVETDARPSTRSSDMVPAFESFARASAFNKAPEGVSFKTEPSK